jgi:hypothetical protein
MKLILFYVEYKDFYEHASLLKFRGRQKYACFVGLRPGRPELLLDTIQKLSILCILYSKCILMGKENQRGTRLLLSSVS